MPDATIPNIRRKDASQRYLELLIELTAVAKAKKQARIYPRDIHEACAKANLASNVGGGTSAKSPMSGTALGKCKTRALDALKDAAENEGMTEADADALIKSIGADILPIADIANTGSLPAMEWLNRHK